MSGAYDVFHTQMKYLLERAASWSSVDTAHVNPVTGLRVSFYFILFYSVRHVKPTRQPHQGLLGMNRERKVLHTKQSPAYSSGYCWWWILLKQSNGHHGKRRHLVEIKPLES